MKPFKIITVMLWVGFVSLLVIVAASRMPFKYFYCLSQEKAWMKSKTLDQLESEFRVPFMKEDSVPIEQTNLGRHQLSDNEQITRYLIFNELPLEVVSSAGVISKIHPAYD